MPTSIDDKSKNSAQIAVEDNPASETQIYRPSKTEVLYTTLLDQTPINPAKVNDTQPSNDIVTSRTTPATQILYDTHELNPPAPSHFDTKVTDFAPVSSHVSSQANSPNPATPQTTVNHEIFTKQADEILHKTHKSDNLTDKNILAKSHQLIPTQDALADDSNAMGQMIEHLGVATKQWDFTVNWERSYVPKSGLINQFKKKTDVLDLDLACLLCNRYGEVIEKVWFKNMRDQAESARHRGDELMGSKPVQPIQEENPDSSNPDTLATASLASQTTPQIYDRHVNQERISVYFSRIPPQVFHLVFVVSSYQNHALAKAKNGVCQLVDDENNVITEVPLAKLAADCRAVRVATLTRASDSWRYHADLTQLNEHKLDDIARVINQTLVRTAK